MVVLVFFSLSSLRHVKSIMLFGSRPTTPALSPFTLVISSKSRSKKLCAIRLSVVPDAYHPSSLVRTARRGGCFDH